MEVCHAHQATRMLPVEKNSDVPVTDVAIIATSHFNGTSWAPGFVKLIATTPSLYGFRLELLLEIFSCIPFNRNLALHLANQVRRCEGQMTTCPTVGISKSGISLSLRRSENGLLNILCGK